MVGFYSQTFHILHPNDIYEKKSQKHHVDFLDVKTYIAMYKKDRLTLDHCDIFILTACPGRRCPMPPVWSERCEIPGSWKH